MNILADSDEDGLKDVYSVIARGELPVTLGEYESKEHCLEILDEIQEACLSYHESTGGFNIPNLPFYVPRVYSLRSKVFLVAAVYKFV